MIPALLTIGGVFALIDPQWAAPINSALLIVLAVIARRGTIQIKRARGELKAVNKNSTEAANAAAWAASAAADAARAAKDVGGYFRAQIGRAALPDDYDRAALPEERTEPDEGS